MIDKMANFEFISNDCPTSHKKPRIDCLVETDLGSNKDSIINLDIKTEDKCSFDGLGESLIKV